MEMESCNAVLLEEACGHQWAGDEILVIFPLERLRCRRNLCEKPLRGLPVHASSHAQHLYAGPRVEAWAAATDKRTWIVNYALVVRIFGSAVERSCP